MKVYVFVQVVCVCVLAYTEKATLFSSDFQFVFQIEFSSKLYLLIFKNLMQE